MYNVQGTREQICFNKIYDFFSEGVQWGGGGVGGPPVGLGGGGE